MRYEPSVGSLASSVPTEKEHWELKVWRQCGGKGFTCTTTTRRVWGNGLTAERASATACAFDAVDNVVWKGEQDEREELDVVGGVWRNFGIVLLWNPVGAQCVEPRVFGTLFVLRAVPSTVSVTVSVALDKCVGAKGAKP